MSDLKGGQFSDDPDGDGGYLADYCKGWIKWHKIRSKEDLADLPYDEVYELAKNVVDMLGYYHK
jgi:hypothetical protein